MYNPFVFPLYMDRGYKLIKKLLNDSFTLIKELWEENPNFARRKS